VNVDSAQIARAVAYMSPEEREELDQLLAGVRIPFRLEDILFGPQLKFARDPAPFADAVCSRRAGKSVGVGAWLIEGPLENPQAPSLYATLTRASAKRIIWPTLLDLNRRYDLGFEPNEAELILKRNGLGAVYLIGVDNKSEIEKARGVGWGRVAIDEAQALPSYLKEFVEDVLTPALMDHNGRLRLIGTPSPVPVGYFHDTTKDPEWEHHHWTVFQNPWIEKKSGKKPEEHLAAVLRRRGVTSDDPSIQREWFGRWAHDPNALVFRYEASRNAYSALPPLGGTWRYAIGIDVGFDDADAIAVLAWSDQDPRTWLIEEHVQPKQDITSLAELVKGIWLRLGRENVVAMVMDTGGVGKKVAEELSARHHLPVAPAQKQDKQSHIEILNDALRTGRLLVKPDGRFAHDALLVEWDREKSREDRRVISENFHSDIADAVLYAFRESLAWTSRVPDQQPPPGSREHMDAEARRMFEATRAAVKNEQAEKAETWGPVGGDFESLGRMDWGVE
jgi:hypothetical protein